MKHIERPTAGPSQFFVFKMRREEPNGRIEHGEVNADLIKPLIEQFGEERGRPIEGVFGRECSPRRPRGSTLTAFFRRQTIPGPKNAAAHCSSLEPLDDLCPPSLFQVVEHSRQKFDCVSIRVNDRMIEPGAYGRGLRRGCGCHILPPLLLLRL